jgi:non-ribosomal peptide synthase protein (TIGR01720 family)
MDLAEFLADAAEKGIVFSIEDDRLRCHIPKGLPSRQLADVVANNKEEIMRLLNTNSRKRRSPHAEQGLVVGPVPLAPIQKWFFGQKFADQHHWNQCVLLEFTRLTAFDDVVAVFAALIGHHDALRFRYHQDQDTWVQSDSPPQADVPVSCFDFTDLDEDAAQRKATQICNDAQAALDLSDGTLLRAILFNNVGHNRAQRLFIAIHHLVVDGVSWRIILEDLAAALSLVARGEPVVLQRKSTSYKYWTEQLAQHAKSNCVLQEIDYWLKQPWHAVKELPRDFDRTGDGENTVLLAEEVSVAFSAEETKRLLQEANVAYRTYIDELLVAALVRSYQQWSGHSEILLGLEGHGRREFQRDLDLTRTVGWFTTLYPVVLRTYPRGDLPELIKNTKETLRQVPNKGFGFGLLRFIVGDPAICSIPAPEIVFNYLGQFTQPNVADSPIVGCDGPMGAPRSPSGQRAEAMTINAIVSRAQMRVTFSFGRRIHRRESITDFAAKFRAALLALTDHCLSTATGGRTPADFPLVDVSQAQIDELESRYRAIDDWWPLTSTQEGFLYTSLAAADKPYVEQIAFEVRRKYDPAKLERAWCLLQERHPILRAIVHFPAQCPTLVVLANERPEQRFSCVDWRKNSVSEKSANAVRLRAEAIRQAGFDLLAAPANRMDLILLDECRFVVVWTFHHILLDGWSNARVFGEWLALSVGVGVSELPPATSFSTYLSWLQKQDRAAAIAYWVDYLGAIDKVESIGTRKRCVGKQARAARKLSRKFGVEVSQAVRDLGRRHGVSLSAVIQVAWGLVLHKYSASEHVMFGKTVSGRSAQLQDSASVVGSLLNTVPVCIEFGAADDFWQIVDRVQKREVAGHEYDYVSAAQIQKALAYRKDTPFYESILVFENYPKSKSHGDSLAEDVGEVELIVAEGGETPYLLTLLFLPNDIFSVDMIYDETRIASHYVEEIVANLQQLITQIAQRKSRLNDLLAAIEMVDRPVINEFARGTASEHAPPTNSIEEKMLEIWKHTLQVEDIGINDNFFEIGGHSLTAVDLISSMNVASLRCSIKDLTEMPSIKLLAGRIRAKEALDTPKTVGSPRVPLLPIQMEAIEGVSLTDRSALPGVPYLFDLDAGINKVALIQALDAWYRQDIFRLRFFAEAGVWKQGPEPASAYTYAPIREFVLGPEEDLVQKVVGLSLELERHLSVLDGPTIQIGLITVGGATRYMLWSLDHLVSDFITANILLTNLKLMYRQVLRGQMLSVQNDDVLYEWSKYLSAMAHGASVCREMEFWLSHFDVEASILAERSALVPAGSMGGAVNEVVTEVVGEALTNGINRFICEQRISFEDLCLGIFLWAHKCCFPESQLLLRMICNGRDEVCGEVDLTRGAGWFSVRYPAIFTLNDGLEQSGFLLDIARQHDRYRVNRKNYGLLRYLNMETASRLARAEDWSKSIAFNCWGEVASDKQGTDISASSTASEILREFLRTKRSVRDAAGLKSGNDPTRGILFFVSEGKLSIQYSFNNYRTDREQVRRLLAYVGNGLAQLVDRQHDQQTMSAAIK